jgi:hypothetical protein
MSFCGGGVFHQPNKKKLCEIAQLLDIKIV